MAKSRWHLSFLGALPLTLLLPLNSGIAEGLLRDYPAWSGPILREFAGLYRPELEARGRRLEIKIIDESPLAIATVGREGDLFQVIVHAGFLTSPRLTPDGLRFALCHEMGHLIGGAPRRALPPEWEGPAAPDGLTHFSSEGQADAYTGWVCFRRLVAGQDHLRALERAGQSVRLDEQCDRAWGSDSEMSLICRRTAWGGLDMLQLVKEFPISFETPDPSRTGKLIRDEYPPRQCRLDTIVATALCRDERPLELDFDDSTANECSEPAGRRPSCWYPQPR